MDKAKGIFITGTDTGVGKTYVAAGIACRLASTGMDIGVMKPAETGCRTRDGKLIPSDALSLMQAAGSRDPLSLVNPYRFREALAPAVAAGIGRRRISVKRILAAFNELSTRHEFMIVEGAGGIMVPLWKDYLYLDLAQALRLPVVIVARPGLGTINHTLLTVAALRERGIAVRGIVINYCKRWGPGQAEKTNPRIIGKLSGTPILGVVPYRSRNFIEIAEERRSCLRA